jgi:hypothetical protein
MAQGRLGQIASFDSSELHSAPDNGADFLSQEKAEIYPKTYEDIVEWMSRQKQWFQEAVKPKGQKDVKAAQEARSLEYAARRRVFIDIDWHHQVSGDSQSVYEELLEDFYQARLQVKAPRGFMAEKSDMDRLGLGHFLIRHKLVKALTEDGLAIRHASVSESESGADFIVPVSSASDEHLKIWVQPGANRMGEIRAIPSTGRNWYLHMPLKYGDDMSKLGSPEVSMLGEAFAGAYHGVDQQG